MKSKRCSKPASIAETGGWRRRPQSAVRAHLTVIDSNPGVVEDALTNES
jgi:hypothetical protein